MTARKPGKVRSGSLQFTIFIGILIALILAGLMLFANTFIRLREQSKSSIEIIQQADNAILSMRASASVSLDTIQIPAGDKGISIQAHLSGWGLFEKAISIATHRQKQFKKCAIISASALSTEDPTLFLADNYSPLTVVGSTKITGIANIPAMGIRPGYIAGNSYYGTELIYGHSRHSTAKLPELDPVTKARIKSLLTAPSELQSRDYAVLPVNTKTIHSFTQRTYNVYSASVIELSNLSAVGNIIVRSDTLIRVSNTAMLKDLILIAPNIELQDGVQGSFQAIASNKIAVGKNCILSYPSAIVLYNSEIPLSPSDALRNLSSQIVIGSGTKIHGPVVWLGELPESNFETQMVFEAGTWLKGQIYCQGNLELKGRVSGSVYTDQFIANQAGSKYMNHLYNGIIENENIAGEYGGLPFPNRSKSIMKWMY